MKTVTRHARSEVFSNSAHGCNGASSEDKGKGAKPIAVEITTVVLYLLIYVNQRSRCDAGQATERGS
jgi:hypothetical protein